MAVDAVLRSGQLAGDGNLPEFEQQLRAFLGATHVTLTAEFSRSIEMVLRMAGVRPGDSVLLSPLACLATTMPLLQVGAKPVWCDIDPNSGGILPEEIPRHHRHDAKAVLVYHWVGVPADITAIRQTAGALGLAIIEDAGEALGAERDGRRVGAHGCDYTVFSFSPVRHITTGEGAAISFADASNYQLATIWRRYGIPPSEFRDGLGEIRQACDIAVPGFHNFMNRIAGALGVLQMDALPGIIAACRSNGAFFDKALDGADGVYLLPHAAGTVPSYWVYCLRCERRDDLLRKLREAGIYASTVHARNDAYSCFGGSPANLPGVDAFAREQLCLPCGWWVTSEDREYIAATIRNGW